MEKKNKAILYRAKVIFAWIKAECYVTKLQSKVASQSNRESIFYLKLIFSICKSKSKIYNYQKSIKLVLVNVNCKKGQGKFLLLQATLAYI